MAGQLIDEYPTNTKRNGCLNCGAPRRPGEYLYQFDQLIDEVEDLDGHVHGFKVAVLCEASAIEIGTLMGCLGPEAKKRLDGLVANLKEQLRQAELRLDAVKSAAGNLSRA